jgi:glutamate synthase domain-containing protein 3
MSFIARGVREYMAELGFRTFDEMVGRTDLLDRDSAIGHLKTKGLDFSRIFYIPEKGSSKSLCCFSGQDVKEKSELDETLIKAAQPAITSNKKVNMTHQISNTQRAVGATLSAEVSRNYGEAGLPEDTVSVNFSGSAGQSFGAFLASGITFQLEGDANDYVGKGLSGGKLIIRPPKEATFLPHKNAITGNVNLFGATKGEVYISGLAGERFAVRNSGAIAVVEGVGDHGCEYMTGGRVIVLGLTGVNFAAGMSGGIAYILDENQLFDTRCNLEMVDIEPVMKTDDIQFLEHRLNKHLAYTNSPRAKEILDNWDEILPYFIKVIPIEYKRALERIDHKRFEEAGSIGMTEEVFV